MLQDRRILLIISGGIAAYKSLELIRRLREQGAAVRCIMTAAAQQFVTPLSVASLSEDKVYGDLWSLTDESEMGHIRLSREADLVVVAPATRRSDRADGDGAGRRPRGDDAARLGQAGADRADDECADVGASGDPGEPRDARGARRPAGRPRRGRTRLRRGRLGPHGRADRDHRRDRACLGRRRAARRKAGAGDQRADARADRSGALYLEPFLGQAGPCDRRRTRRARRRDGARLGADAGAGAGRGQARAGRDRGGNARRLRGGAAGRCRGDGGGRRRLAGRNRRPAAS